MTNLQKMQALQDAHVILSGVACQVATGTKAVWTILNHAQQHINRQMGDALRETSEQEVEGDEVESCAECGNPLLECECGAQ